MEYAIVFGIIIWGIIFGAFCSFLAKQKKRDQGSWFALGFFFSLIALIAIAATPVQEKKIAEPIRLEPRKPLTRGQKILRIVAAVAFIIFVVILWGQVLFSPSK